MALVNEGVCHSEIGRRIGITKQAVYSAVDRITRKPSETAIANIREHIAAMDRLSRLRALTDEESHSLERAIRLEAKYNRSFPGTTSLRRKWTPDEDELVMCASNAAQRLDVARKTGRTACAVMQRRTDLRHVRHARVV